MQLERMTLWSACSLKELLCGAGDVDSATSDVDDGLCKQAQDPTVVIGCSGQAYFTNGYCCNKIVRPPLGWLGPIPWLLP